MFEKCLSNDQCLNIPVLFQEDLRSSRESFVDLWERISSFFSLCKQKMICLAFIWDSDLLSGSLGFPNKHTQACFNFVRKCFFSNISRVFNECQKPPSHLHRKVSDPSSHPILKDFQASDWSKQVTWPVYWSLIGREGTHGTVCSEYFLLHLSAKKYFRKKWRCFRILSVFWI